ncbi:Homeodomain-like protein [Cynara cardunculus var. scolymus]|uniref:Homeodomain-like protein n=1 Tax=Cynara cardunculus var. scolymus TaxID=59895 RepID=A0A103XMZ2_CYNCS|nr:Homeodomain-like protein [Cynara cardunculus var. scolymus]
MTIRLFTGYASQSDDSAIHKIPFPKFNFDLGLKIILPISSQSQSAIRPSLNSSSLASRLPPLASLADELTNRNQFKIHESKSQSALTQSALDLALCLSRVSTIDRLSDSRSRSRILWLVRSHLLFGFKAVKNNSSGATPKSVLELMDVKDLTLSHVKSHLQHHKNKFWGFMDFGINIFKLRDYFMINVDC